MTQRNPAMKSKVTTKTNRHGSNDVVLQVAHAEARVERTEREARLAKGEFKRAKKDFRQAKKAAKQARKAFKELSKRLKEQVARRPRRKKLKTKTVGTAMKAEPTSATTA
jgi:hypothetical protein